MVKCEYCGKEIDDYLPFKCKYCGGIFCADHYLPENHDCPGIKKMKWEENPHWKLKKSGGSFRKRKKRIFRRLNFWIPALFDIPVPFIGERSFGKFLVYLGIIMILLGIKKQLLSWFFIIGVLMSVIYLLGSRNIFLKSIGILMSLYLLIFIYGLLFGSFSALLIAGSILESITSYYSALSNIPSRTYLQAGISSLAVGIINQKIKNRKTRKFVTLLAITASVLFFLKFSSIHGGVPFGLFSRFLNFSVENSCRDIVPEYISFQYGAIFPLSKWENGFSVSPPPGKFPSNLLKTCYWGKYAGENIHYLYCRNLDASKYVKVVDKEGNILDAHWEWYIIDLELKPVGAEEGSIGSATVFKVNRILRCERKL